jgi:hypothetical protein
MREKREIRGKRGKRDPGSRLPGVLLASLGLAVLGATVMWSAVSTAQGASGRSTDPDPDPNSVMVPIRSRAPSFTLVSTVISDAHVLRDLTESGHRLKRAVAIETVPVTILADETLAQAPRRKTARRTARPAPRQEPSSSKATPAAKPVAKPAARPAAKPRGRLPRYFGKVGVSAIQKRRVYAIQAIYRDRAEILTRQLEELRSQERLEVLEVLTALQKQRLAELIRMAEVAREARLRARQQGQSRKSGPSRPIPPGTSKRAKSGAGGTSRR